MCRRNADLPSSRDNVCVLKDEVTEDWNGNEVNVGTQPDFSINIQTCAEQSNKYVCKTM